MKPNNEDWRRVWNALYKSINQMSRYLNKYYNCNQPIYPLLSKTDNCIPTEEYLDEWERLFPGTKEKFTKMAHDEMQHRLKMEKERSPLKKLLYRWRKYNNS